MKTLQYIGKEPTRVRSEYGAEKKEVKPNGRFEVNEEMAKIYLTGAYKKSFVLLGEKIETSVVSETKVQKSKR